MIARSLNSWAQSAAHEVGESQRYVAGSVSRDCAADREYNKLRGWVGDTLLDTYNENKLYDNPELAELVVMEIDKSLPQLGLKWLRKEFKQFAGYHESWLARRHMNG